MPSTASSSMHTKLICHPRSIPLPNSLFVHIVKLNPTMNTAPSGDVHARRLPYTSLMPVGRREECVSSYLYIGSLGFGTVIDEYTLTGSSFKLMNRWIPPKTCANHEGIWCIRYHPETDQLGCAIVDATNNQWRLEIRSRESFACLWRINMPFLSGDCEISPFPNGEWLATNSFNIRLLQIGYQVLKSAVEYERELKNAIVINDLYLVIRTKSTVEVHRLDGPKWCHLCLMWIEKEFWNRFIEKERRKKSTHRQIVNSVSTKKQWQWESTWHTQQTGK